MIIVGEIMSSPPLTCRPDDSLSQPARLMWDHDCGSVIVTSYEGRLVGIITDRDVCMAAYTRGKPLHEIRVGDIMAKQVWSCQAAAPVRWALHLMAQHHVRRLPVVGAHDCALGAISLNNIIRYAAAGDARLQREVFETIDQISQPRPHEAERSPRYVSGVFEKASPQHALGAISERKP